MPDITSPADLRKFLLKRLTQVGSQRPWGPHIYICIYIYIDIYIYIFWHFRAVRGVRSLITCKVVQASAERLSQEVSRGCKLDLIA